MQSGGSTGDEVVRPSPEGGGETRTVLIAPAAVEPGEGGEPGLAPGTRLGRYRIHSLLGRGGMGEVYRAEQLEPVRREVAIKLVRGQRLDLRQLAWFEVERQVLAGLHHPAIAQVFDAGATDDGHPYFVMEYIQGEPITRYCESRQLSLRQRIVLMVMVCDGVQHAHQKGVIHRDLKPANLLVEDSDGRAHPKLIDFGIATPGGRAMARLQGEAGAIGTPAYMSPEQGDASQSVDVRSDVYSLGVVLSQLITGQRPEGSESASGGVNTGSRTRRRPSELFRGGEVASTQQRAQALGLSPRSFRRVLRSELDWVVLKATRHERDQRYASAAELAEDLRAFLDGRPLKAVPATRAYRWGNFASRHRWGLAGAAAAVLSLLVGLTMAVYGLHQARERQLELEQVASFQQSLIEQLDVEAMGAGILALQDAEIAAADPEAAAAWERLRPRFNGTELAADMIDRHLLAPAVAAVPERFGEQPRVAAALLDELGRAYSNGIGRHDTAASVWALALAQSGTGGDDASERVRYYAMRASALRRMDQREGADEALALAHAEAEAAGLARVDTGRLYLDLERALAYQADGDFTAARQASESVIERLRAAPPGEGRDRDRRERLLASARVAQASAQLRLDALEEAIAALQAAEEDELARGAADQRPLILIRSRLAVAHAINRSLDLAEPIQAELVRTQVARLGRFHTDTLAARNNLATMWINMERFEEAERALREVLADRARVLGQDHPETLRTTLNLSSLLVRTREPARRVEALALIEGVVKAREVALGPDHPDTLLALGNYSDLVRMTRGPADALPLARRIHEARTAQFPPGHLERLRAIEHLALVLEQLGRHPEALALAEAGLEEAGGARRGQTIEVYLMTREIVSLHATGREQEAARKLAEALRPALAASADRELETRVEEGLARVGLSL